MRHAAPIVASLLSLLAGCGGCGKRSSGAPAMEDATASSSAFVVSSSAPASIAPGSPRTGMAWIPAGVLRAGTPADKVPRIAEEELPGTEFALGGFYIDLLPFPNEAGAIPTSNVTRDEAAKLCEGKGKRLCTEFEWERACKGSENTTYEYGDPYRAAACGTGIPASEGARRPSGERVGCKSAFGAMDMHGGVWEWTDSPWRRGSKTELGVLRGGNARAGELVGRCANAIARKSAQKAGIWGLRCCAGARNPQENELVVSALKPLERSVKPKEIAAPLVPVATTKWGSDGAGAFVPRQAWTWHPVANEELLIVSGCAQPPDSSGKKGARCGVVIARVGRAEPAILADIDSGHEAADVAQFGEPRHLRMRGLDVQGAFLREISYAYGRVDVAAMKRR